MTDLLHTVLSAALGGIVAGILSGFAAWNAIRVTLAKQQQKLEDHIVEVNRRFERIEKVVGIDGTQPAFMRREETEAAFQHNDERWETVQDVLAELRAGQKEIRALMDERG